MALATGTALAIGAAVGAAKYASEQEAASRQRKLQATLTTYSPWTGYRAPGVTDPNAFGDIVQGAGSLGMLNQGFAGADAAAGAGAAGAGSAAGLSAGAGAASPTLVDPNAYSALNANQATSPWAVMGQMNSFTKSPFSTF